MKLIDADKVNETIDRFIGYLDEDMILRIKMKISKIPTVDRPHGEWKPGREISQMWTGDKLVAIDYEDFSCSCCGVVVEESTEPVWNFCPNCGASMRKEG